MKKKIRKVESVKMEYESAYDKEVTTSNYKRNKILFKIVSLICSFEL